MPSPHNESKSKRRKTEPECNTPHITADKPGNSQIISNFIMASNCWDLLRSTEGLYREFTKLSRDLKIENALNDFRIDYALYKGCYDDALVLLPTIPETVQGVSRNIRLACLYFCKKNYSVSKTFYIVHIHFHGLHPKNLN